MKRLDFLIIIIVLLAGGIGLLAPRIAASAAKGDSTESLGAYSEITSAGEVVATLPLGEDRDFLVTNGAGQNLVRVKDGGVSIAEANCANQSCVHMGELRPGSVSVIACLPNRLIVRIVGAGEGEGSGGESGIGDSSGAGGSEVDAIAR